jgi:hypothetical protein
VTSAVCEDCNGARSVPDLGEYEDGYAPCPSCVIDAGETFVVWEETLGRRDTFPQAGSGPLRSDAVEVPWRQVVELPQQRNNSDREDQG